MNFLIDENLSPRLPDLLARLGHDADHVGAEGHDGDPDPDQFRLAIRYDALITSDAFKDAATRPIAHQAMARAIRIVHLKRPKTGGFPASRQAAWIERHLTEIEREVRDPAGARHMSIIDLGETLKLTPPAAVRRWLADHGLEAWPAEGPGGAA